MPTLVPAVALLLLAQQAAAPARSLPVRPGLSWAEADSLVRKLQGLESGAPRGRKESPLLVTEGELNSFINLSLGPQIPPGITDLAVSMEQDRLAAKAIVDLERVRDRLPPMGAFNPLSYLGGRVPLEIRSRVASADGFGSLQVEEVRLGGLPVPVSLVGQFVASATRTRERPEGFDIQAPFRLPYSVKRVRVQADKALLER